MNDLTEHGLRAREAERCAALVAGDRERLAALLDEELVHVHTNGSCEDKAAYLATAFSRLRFVEAERDDLRVRIEGRIGIMTGGLAQRIEIRSSGEIVSLRAFVTQLWIAAPDGWRLLRFQATKTG